MRLVVTVMTLLLLAGSSWGHTCMQDDVYDMNDQMEVLQTYANTYPYENNTLPIRMRVDTTYLFNDLRQMTCERSGQEVPSTQLSANTNYTCKSSDVLTASLRGYLVSLLDQARDLFQATLLVMPVQGSLQLSGDVQPAGLYGGVYISNEYTTGVPNLDVVIFVTARPILQDSSGSSSTLAVARVVQEDQIGRPIMGHLNINPAGIDVTTAMFKRNFGVVIHEMTHALGFTTQKFERINPDPTTVRCLFILVY